MGWGFDFLQGQHTLDTQKSTMPWELFLISQWICQGSGGQLNSSSIDAMVISSSQTLQLLGADVGMSKSIVLFVYCSQYEYTRRGLQTV